MIIGVILMIVLWLSIIAFAIVSQWKVFEKAGQPGWAVFIPIYNILIMLKVANKPWWWIFMLFIPIANIVFAIMLLHRISLSFGKSGGFTVGLLFLGIIFWGILAFDKSEYQMIPNE
ncbi:MAG: signal peptidase I [Sphingobacteriaceae bacterium]|nr:signal peptidase I [Sphingobacteriaceae bacterium]